MADAIEISGECDDPEYDTVRVERAEFLSGLVLDQGDNYIAINRRQARALAAHLLAFADSAEPDPLDVAIRDSNKISQICADAIRDLERIYAKIAATTKPDGGKG